MALLNQFRQWMMSEMRPMTTIEAYCRDVDKFLAYWDMQGQPPFIGELVNQHLLLLADKGYTPKSLNRMRMGIRQFYHWLSINARLKGFLEETVRIDSELSLIDPIKEVRKNLPVITPEDKNRMIAACECRGENAFRNKAIVKTLHSSGIRVSELCTLNLNCVSEASCRLRVMGKGSRERMVPISGDCLRAIQDYVGHWRTRHAQPGNPALFIYANGDRMKRRHVTNILTRLSERFWGPHVTAHTMRRTRATQLLNKGTPIEEVQRLLGHESLDATQQYLAISMDRLKEVYRRCHPRMEDAPRQEIQSTWED